MSSQLEFVDEQRTPEESEDFASYRAMSTLAIGSLVAGILSILALVEWVFGVIPILGILLGWRARRQIRANPQELTGLPLANTGLALSALFLAGGWTLLSVIYVTEVPEGYKRISYSDLQPPTDEGTRGNVVRADIIPPSARALHGKKVFIKGYMFPGTAQQSNLSTFILVRDNGACCFGPSGPKLTDMILVTMKGSRKADYTTRTRKLAGVFAVETKQLQADDQDLANGNVSGVLYQLEAEYMQ
jgi:hypothetical protein